VNTALRSSIRHSNRIEGRTASVPAHEKVYDAIVARNPRAASEAMRAIIVEVQRLIERGVPARAASKSARRKKAAAR
jgi:DNA-binding FadR family transcriptional regulator